MEKFLQESWSNRFDTEKGNIDKVPSIEKDFFILFALRDEVPKIKNKKTQKYLQKILNELEEKIIDYSKDIEIIETPAHREFLTIKTWDNKRRMNHNAIMTKLLILYRYFRKDNLDISWAEDLVYDDKERGDIKKFDSQEVTNWALNTAKILQEELDETETPTI